MQLLYVANRYEYKQEIVDAHGGAARSWSATATWRRASPTARRRGSIAAWLVEIQKYLPQPDLTILLDIPPEASARRKSKDRDKYEQDLALLARVRDSYLRQAAGGGWVRIDADRDRDAVAADVFAAIADRV